LIPAKELVSNLPSPGTPGPEGLEKGNASASRSTSAGNSAVAKLNRQSCVQLIAVEAKTNKNLEVTTWWGRMLVGRRPARTLARLIVLILVSFVLFKFLFLPIRVVGDSMVPTYHNGRINLINRLAFRWHTPKRGDVVAVQLDKSRLVLLKRVVGLPGERVAVRAGHVVVNGRVLDEPYAKVSESPPSQNEILLGADEYFVIGDNRDISASVAVHQHEFLGKIVF
jgi:signal peptidase I